jgi:ABC-2 type transport system ATP-binding protein
MRELRDNGTAIILATHDMAAVSQHQFKENYAIYFSYDISQTVPALINYVQDQADELIDLRVERPSLEERFLELTDV